MTTRFLAILLLLAALCTASVEQRELQDLTRKGGKTKKNPANMMGMQSTTAPVPRPTTQFTSIPVNIGTPAPIPGVTPAPINAVTSPPTPGVTPGVTPAPTAGVTTAPTPGVVKTLGPTPGPTSGPTPGPTFAPTFAPTLAPTPSPTALPTTPSPVAEVDPITPATATIVSATNLPGGLLDTLSETETKTFFNDTYAYSGSLRVAAGGGVSLKPVADKIPLITCDASNRSIQIDFNETIGARQLPYIFPIGAVLVIHRNFTACNMSPSTIPEGITAVSADLESDTYFLIERVVVKDDLTITVFGKSADFFTLFPEGSLSISLISTSRRLEFEQDMEEPMHNTTDRRHLAFLANDIFTVGITTVSATVRHIEAGGPRSIEAQWDADGLAMTANLRLEFLVNVDLEVALEAGVATPGKFVGTDSNLAQIARFLPSIITEFPKIGIFELPDYLFDMYTEAPLFANMEGMLSEGFAFSTRLRYASGRKDYIFSASGPWDAIVASASLQTIDLGRLAASTTTSVGNESFQETGMFENLKVYGGAKPSLVVYSPLFSTWIGLDVGLNYVASGADPFFPPIFIDSGVDLVGRCFSCSTTNINVFGRNTAMGLVGTVGNFVDTDLVGPSNGNSPANLQFTDTIIPLTNPAEAALGGRICLYPQFGASTLPCGEFCCDGSDGRTECVGFQCVKV